MKRSDLKIFAAVVALGLFGYAAYAENITISTFYPSPYGSYQTLETTGTTTLATGATTALLVGTNTAAANNVKLSVQGGAIGTSDAVGGNGNGAAYMEATGSEARYGALLSTTMPVWIGNSTAPSQLIVSSAAVAVAGNFSVLNGTMTVKDTASGGSLATGILQTVCSSGNCYAVAVYS